MKRRAIARRGLAAWSSGDLDRAVELLAPLAAQQVDAIDVVCPLARAYSERGDRNRALATLDPVVAAAARPALLVRAEVLFDHGPGDEAEQLLRELSTANPIAGGLLKLLQARHDGDNPSEIVLPRAARWMPGVMGRLLAHLEGRLLAAGPAEFAGYHARALVPEGASADDPIDRALYASDFKEVIRICRQDAEAAAAAERRRGRLRLFRRVKGYPPVYRQWVTGFAQTLLGEETDAARTLAEALRAGDSRVDFLLLSGLHHARFGRPRQAGTTFACAARLSDIAVSDNIDALASRLRLQIRLEDAG